MAIVEHVASSSKSSKSGKPGKSGSRKLRLLSPIDLEPIGEIQVQSKAEVDAAIAKARAAQPAWAALSIKRRAMYMEKALKILLRRMDEYIDVFVRESGKARMDALMIEIWAAADSLGFFSKHAEEFLKPEKVKLHGFLRFLKTVTLEYRPLGVVGVISPWNGPFILSLNPAVQAMLAGNTVVIKPSEVTPMSGKLVEDLFREAGLPEGVCTVVLGDGETGGALVEGKTDKISFTGSVPTGRIVAQACAKLLKPCTLELGGKDGMIVCADADLDVAAAGAVAGSLFNTGQYCSGTERIYVVKSVADAFTAKVVERVQALRQNDRGEFDVGAIFWQKQLEIIENQVQQAVKKGAKVLVGGKRNKNLKGLYYEPTVMVNVNHGMDLMSKETFGPIIPIVVVKDEDEAIRMCNDSDYGLGATVWSQDNDKAYAIAQRIQSGSVCINDMCMTYGALEVPFGGIKDSGIGSVNGKSGLRAYTVAKPIIVDKFGGKYTVARHYPYSQKGEAQMKKLIKMLWGNKISRRVL